MNGSEHLNEIAPALVAAQRTLRNPKADSKATVPTKSGGSYSYRYLSLPALLDAVRTTFKELGLACLQEVTRADGGIAVTTRIVHLSGQWIELGPLVMPAGGGPQEHGSAVTYARRYALAAAVGLAADEDDDAAQVKPPRSEAGAHPPAPAPDAGKSKADSQPAPSGEGEGQASPSPDSLLAEATKLYKTRRSLVNAAAMLWEPVEDATQLSADQLRVLIERKAS